MGETPQEKENALEDMNAHYEKDQAIVLHLCHFVIVSGLHVSVLGSQPLKHLPITILHPIFPGHQRECMIVAVDTFPDCLKELLLQTPGTSQSRG
jgi:hypothetical protein